MLFITVLYENKNKKYPQSFDLQIQVHAHFVLETKKKIRTHTRR